uniref:Uncharacterized protein n=1 Tax=Arundo donax TaxID=35708 RepID=A0A0A8YFN6_ARUDO
MMFKIWYKLHYLIVFLINFTATVHYDA